MQLTNTSPHSRRPATRGASARNRPKNTIFIIGIAILLCGVLFCGAAAATLTVDIDGPRTLLPGGSTYLKITNSEGEDTYIYHLEEQVGPGGASLFTFETDLDTDKNPCYVTITAKSDAKGGEHTIHVEDIVYMDRKQTLLL